MSVVMLLPGTKGLLLLVQRTVTRTIVLQETIGKVLSILEMVEAIMILAMMTVAPNFGPKRGSNFEEEALKPGMIEANTQANGDQDGRYYSSLVCSSGGYGNGEEVKSLESQRSEGEQHTGDFS
ncbi:hypothetical protein STEG23_036187 [Scotinomys teguina]